MEILDINEYVKKKGGISKVEETEVYAFRFSNNMNSIFKNVSGNLIPTKVTIKYYKGNDSYIYLINAKGKIIDTKNVGGSAKEEDKYVRIAETKEDAIEQYSYLLDKRIDLQTEEVMKERERLEKIKDSLLSKVK